MKHLKLLVFLPPLLSAMLSCEDDDSFELNADFRLKMIVYYEDDILQYKKLYSYEGNRIDSIQYYYNVYGSDPYGYEYGLITYERSGDVYFENWIGKIGNMTVSNGRDEYEFEGSVLIRYNNEFYTYRNSLLIERDNTDTRYKSTYEYLDDRVTGITTVRYNEGQTEYEPEERYIFEYKGDSIIADRYYFDRNDQVWTLYRRMKYFFINNLVSSKEQLNGPDLEPYTKTEYQYNEKGDITQYKYSYADGESYVTTSTYTYDEYGNIAEMTSVSSGSTNKYLYFYESGGSNIEDFTTPASPSAYYYNLEFF
ncbi:MAG: hypothetical protein JW973_07340 [Bacteroidales bacterium]|nr:hypothetical protein [Bacteroidales bacterium]